MKSSVQKKESKAISNLRKILRKELSKDAVDAICKAATANPINRDNAVLYSALVEEKHIVEFLLTHVGRWEVETVINAFYGPKTKGYRFSKLLEIKLPHKALSYSTSRLIAENISASHKILGDRLFDRVLPAHFEILVANINRVPSEDGKRDKMLALFVEKCMHRVLNATELRSILSKRPQIYRLLNTVEKLQATKMTVSQHLLHMSRYPSSIDITDYITKELFKDMENVCMLEVMTSSANNSKRLLNALNIVKAKVNARYPD